MPRAPEPGGCDVGERGSLGIRPWQKTAGSPAILGDRPEDRRFCVPPFDGCALVSNSGLRPRYGRPSCPIGTASVAAPDPHSDVEQTAFYGASALSRSVRTRQARLCRRLRTLNRENEHMHHMRASHQGTCHLKRSASKPSSGVFAVERWLTSTGRAFYNSRPSWGHSSAGRAPAWHAGGRRFDPVWLHHDDVPIV